MSAEANFVKIPRGESTYMENLKPVWIPIQVAECIEHSLLMLEVRGLTLAPPINMASLPYWLLRAGPLLALWFEGWAVHQKKRNLFQLKISF